MNIINTIATTALTGFLFLGLTFNSTGQNHNAIHEASVNDKMHIHEVKPMQFRVSYYAPESKSFIVRILDTDKNVLFSENKRSDVNYVKYFDLSTLLDGTYTFEITDAEKRFSKSFDVLTKTRRVVSSTEN